MTKITVAKFSWTKSQIKRALVIPAALNKINAKRKD